MTEYDGCCSVAKGPGMVAGAAMTIAGTEEVVVVVAVARAFPKVTF